MDTSSQDKKNQSNIFLPASILIAGVLISGSVIYSTGLKQGGAGAVQEPDSAAEVVDESKLALNDEDVILGDPNAPVTIIEYSDFQCPFCGRFYSQSEGQIKENYIKNGQVKFIYRHFAFLGPESRAAAEAVECAKDQGNFWQYHDQLFDEEIADGAEHNGNLNRELFMELAEAADLDSAEFASCLDAGKYSEKVESDYAGAQALGVRATPTIFVNGTKVEGALPFSYFQALIDSELAK